MNASMWHFQASISDIEASISTSTRRSRDERFDVALPSFDLRHRGFDLDIDASMCHFKRSISTSKRRSFPGEFHQTSFRGEGPVSLLEPPTLLFHETPSAASAVARSLK